jgi:hypothetical protein
MRVRLIVKLAETVNGLDLSHCREGDVIELSDHSGAMLIAEGWAEAVGDAEATFCHAVLPANADGVAEDRQPSPYKPRRRSKSSSPAPPSGDV